ncbi:MAG: hypothetical protein FWD16_01505 [Clostridia bacterium]|nr:hypothetical protein [Clostridia bacterium]
MQVEISKVYSGMSPKTENEGHIKVFFPLSTSLVLSKSFLLKENAEYVFITQYLDDKYVDLVTKDCPEIKAGTEKTVESADVYFGVTTYHLMPIENRNVLMESFYFWWDDDIMLQTKKGIKSDKVSDSRLLEDGSFIVLDQNDFDVAFMRLFENVESLPDADELFQIIERRAAQ